MPVEPAGGLGGAESADQVVEGGEVDGESGLAGGDGERDGEHGFADAGRSEQSHVGLGFDELQRGEILDLAGVQAGLEGEVELVQRFVVRQPGQFQGVAEPAALAQPDLFFEQQVDEVEVAHLRSLGPVTSSVTVSLRWVSPSRVAWSRIRSVVRALTMFSFMLVSVTLAAWA